MNGPKIFTLVGGISSGSINKKLFRAVKEIVRHEAELLTFDIARLPFFSQDIENDPPDIVTEFKEHIRSAEALLFITPEYNRSIPGVLKNAIDWGSRPYGQNLWENLPAGIMGASIGNIGTFGAQHHLRQMLSYLNVVPMNQPEFYLNASEVFDEKGLLVDRNTRDHIQAFWDALKEWISVHGLNSPARPRFFEAKGLEDSPDLPRQ